MSETINYAHRPTTHRSLGTSFVLEPSAFPSVDVGREYIFAWLHSAGDHVTLLMTDFAKSDRNRPGVFLGANH
jgi:hypothetical protein